MESIDEMASDAARWLNDNFTTGVIVLASAATLYFGYQSHEAKRRETPQIRPALSVTKPDLDESEANRAYSSKAAYTHLTGTQKSE